MIVLFEDITKRSPQERFIILDEANPNHAQQIHRRFRELHFKGGFRSDNIAEIERQRLICGYDKLKAKVLTDQELEQRPITNAP